MVPGKDHLLEKDLEELKEVSLQDLFSVLLIKERNKNLLPSLKMRRKLQEDRVGDKHLSVPIVPGIIGVVAGNWLENALDVAVLIILWQIVL